MGPKKAKKIIDIDGVNTTQMTREQLERFALTLKETLDREREERNFFQLERDKIRTFWEITKQQLEECREELRVKERVIEDKEDTHQAESKLFKQKEKHLLYEHQNEITQIRAEGMLALRKAQEDFDEQEEALLLDKRALKEKIIELQKVQQEEIRTLSLEFSAKLSEARNNFEQEARDIEARYHDKFQNLRTDLELRHKMEITEVEERKNKQIAELTKNHDKAFADMKSYYNDITLNNLALISNLKDQMEEMKRREDRMEKALKECQKENRNLVEPMKAALQENYETKMKLGNYAKDKISLVNTKRNLIDLRKELDSLKWENQVLELRLMKMEEEKDMISERYDASVIEVQYMTAMKTVIAERKLKALLDLVEKREAHISEMIRTGKLEPLKTEGLGLKIEKLLSRKNAAIQDLEYELARICKAHDDLLNTYEGKLIQFGIPKEELGFSPLRSCVPTAKGPAMLVTANK